MPQILGQNAQAGKARIETSIILDVVMAGLAGTPGASRIDEEHTKLCILVPRRARRIGNDQKTFSCTVGGGCNSRT